MSVVFNDYNILCNVKRVQMIDDNWVVIHYRSYCSQIVRTRIMKINNVNGAPTAKLIKIWLEWRIRLRGPTGRNIWPRVLQECRTRRRADRLKRRISPFKVVSGIKGKKKTSRSVSDRKQVSFSHAWPPQITHGNDNGAYTTPYKRVTPPPRFSAVAAAAASNNNSSRSSRNDKRHYTPE